MGGFGNSLHHIIQRYRGVADVQDFDDSDSHQQLKACMRRLNCEDFANINLEELGQFEGQLKSSLGKICARKIELLEEQLQALRLQEKTLEEENKELLAALQPQGIPASPVDEQPRELMLLLPSPEPHSPHTDQQPAISGSDLRLAIG